LEKIRNDSPDLVLLDILMPQVSGLSVLKKLESEDIEVPVIVITADIQDSTKRECLELGARDVFYKPLPSETQKLRELVRKVLDSEQEET
jgi:twitching motility two-component system response regulator PilH